MEDLRELYLLVLTWSAMAVGCLLLGLGLWFYLARQGQGLFPPQRHRAVPWSGRELFLVLFLVMVFIPLTAKELLDAIGFFPKLYGNDFPTDIPVGSKDPIHQLALERRLLWIQDLAFPFQVAATLMLLRGLTGARLYQLGLTWRHAANGLALGCLFWVIWTPWIWGLNTLVEWCYKSWGGQPESHPLTRIMEGDAIPLDKGLAVFLALVSGPILEELLFRGLVLFWMARREWGANAGYAVAFALAFRFWDDGPGRWPAFFIVMLLPGYLFAEFLTWRWLPMPDVARSIFSTSLIWAMLHNWPDCVPLFVFGLGLGYLAYRTQSLVGPIFVHSLFNAVSTLVLLLLQSLSGKGV